MHSTRGLREISHSEICHREFDLAHNFPPSCVLSIAHSALSVMASLLPVLSPTKMAEDPPPSGDPAPPEDAAPQHITIKLSDSSGHLTHFRLTRSTPFRQVMEKFRRKHGLQRTSLRFTFDGRQIQSETTADEFGIEDGDAIDVHAEQFGGGARPVSRARGGGGGCASRCACVPGGSSGHICFYPPPRASLE